MSWFIRFQNSLRSLFRRRKAEADLHKELQYHLEQEIENNLRAGMPPAEAKFAAQRLIGSLSLYQEECRDARGIGFLETFARDLGYAVRMLGRTPLFTAVAMFTLAIGIGANTTVFTFVENILLRALPIHDPQQVNALNWGDIAGISYPNYLDLRDRNTVFSSLVAYNFIATSISTQSHDNFRAWGYEATGNYFQALGVNPQLGRFFSPQDDDKLGAHPVVVISHHCWETRFAADPRVIGRSLKINGYPFIIIGVARPSFSGTELLFAADYWVPLSMLLQIQPGYDWTHSRTSQNTTVLGRRKPGVSRAQAEANLDQIAAQIVRAHPNDVAAIKFHLSRPGLLGQYLRGPATNFGIVLMGVAALGLLLACVNLAGMLLARASDRRREVGIRLALGAGRSQLVRQLMTESLFVAISGGFLGLLIAFAACRLFNAWLPAFDAPVQIVLQPNSQVLCFTLAAVILTSILFGLAPALQATRIDLVPSLKNEPVSTRFRRWSPRDFLVAGQIALSVMLVICSILVVRSLQHALTLQLGFNPHNAVSVSFDLTLDGYNDERVRNFQASLLAKTAALPGIQATGIVNNLPLRSGGLDSEFIWRDGTALPKPSERLVAMVYNISSGYLRAAGTALLSGRNIDNHDRHDSPPVILVNQTFAHLLFGAQNPLGRRVRVSSVSQPVEIVGIVEDGKYQSLGEDPGPAVFFPLTQLGTHWTTLVARSSLPAANITALLRKTVLELDPQITLFSTGSLQDRLAFPLIGARIAAIVLGAFGVFAMALAATGLFALMSYAVSRRTREIGIRMALGAKRSQVLSSILGRALLLCAAGIVIGAVITLAAAHLLSAILYDISPRDPITYCAALGVMTVVALLACWTPAARAIHIDPLNALREE
jgi:predicted permease